MSRQPAILSIGDDPDSSRLLKKLLSRSGHHVRSADSMQTALAASAAEPPDLIIADLSMPGAMQLCRLIKAHDHSRDIPVIVITGSANAMDRVEALRAGASDFVTAPFRPEELRMRVDTRLEISRAGKTEPALRGSESRLREIADSLPVMIVASGPNGETTFFNTGWLEFRGRSIDQELGWGWMEGLHPDDRDGFLANYARAFEGRRNYQLEYRLRRGDGEYRWILANGVPGYEAEGVFSGYIACCLDVTGIRRSDQQRQLQQAEPLKLFAAGVAHDFNNLLGAAFAELDMAVSGLPSGSPARQHLQGVESTLNRASELVDLLMSCSTTGNTPARKAVDLSTLVQDVIHGMDGALSRKSVRLTCKPGALVPPILANGPQIRRVLMNLITNAIEALGGKGGSITVSTSFLRIGGDHTLPQQPAGLKHGDYVSLSVADTGPGMTEETLSRALHPFFTTKAHGRGLGLAVVEGIVRSHGGAIRASSTAGRGTTFEVLLPAAPGATGEQDVPREAASAASPAPPRMSVLIVEDERMLRSATGVWLEEQGFRVMYACDGEEAIERLGDSTPDIDAVVLDLTLPDMSGVDLLAKIREIRPEASIVLTSGHDVGAHIRNGNPAFLRKPYRLSDLVQALLKTPRLSEPAFADGRPEPIQ